jgi:hypothetical protein
MSCWRAISATGLTHSSPREGAGGEHGVGVHRVAPHTPRAREIGARGGFQTLGHLLVKQCRGGPGARASNLHSSSFLMASCSWLNSFDTMAPLATSSVHVIVQVIRRIRQPYPSTSYASHAIGPRGPTRHVIPHTTARGTPTARGWPPWAAAASACGPSAQISAPPPASPP